MEEGDVVVPIESNGVAAGAQARGGLDGSFCLRRWKEYGITT